ncbi:hypothetical protein PG993_010004 [Apiospora rasikravindrae]|uniref:DUF7730 domain-containing protein n=1 Tax=Apiospora rasikravindrae TaxID=990691 RepID=A0ABR1SKZ7_9PEZI
MANHDAPRKVMRRPAASIPPRAPRAQDDPMPIPMTVEEHRRWMAQPQHQISASPILRIPAELRVQIYEDVLRAPRALFVPPHLHRRRGPNLPVNCQCDFCRPSRSCCGSSGSVPDGRCMKAHASLLRVCKLIHNETMPIFYGENMFIVPCLVGRPYDAATFFPYHLRLATMCLMKTVAFRDACLCGHWKSGRRRGLEISGKDLAASCFGSKTLTLGAGSFLPLPSRSERTHDEIVRRIRAVGNITNPCLSCASKYSRNRWAII